MWISVKDRLPEKDKDVLVMVDDCMIEGSYDVERAKDYNRGWTFISLASHGCGCCSDGDENITHWMELPLKP